ncbi:MAG: tetratricopeptide repeat protein [Deltaproteobacteria bacterium]|nr:tetratricopeptide repeat protein [Deltaproteobacteria bacterium]
MNGMGTEAEADVLQRRIEHALRASRPREQVQRLLERLVEVAPEGSAASHFAHRNLAELCLERDPWNASLHLRRALKVAPDDDVAQALMGLCQALQGNFRMAVHAFRQAARRCPSNPWYNHNLGHLLDVALGQPQEALGYLRRAWQAQPNQEEVAASLAHCLGRLGQREEALRIARPLLARHPQHPDLKALTAWLEGGDLKGRSGFTDALTAPAVPKGPSEPRAASQRAALELLKTPRGEAAQPAPGASPREGTSARGPAPGVKDELARALSRGGCNPVQVQRALAIWRDLAPEYRTPVTQAAIPALAAALEYALARVDGAAVRQRDIAARHGVTTGSLAARFTDLRQRLGLVPRDARYAR